MKGFRIYLLLHAHSLYSAITLTTCFFLHKIDITARNYYTVPHAKKKKLYESYFGKIYVRFQCHVRAGITLNRMASKVNTTNNF